MHEKPSDLAPEPMDDHLAGFDDRDDEPEDVVGELDLDDLLDEHDDDAHHLDAHHLDAPDFDAPDKDGGAAEREGGLSRRMLLSGVGAVAGGLAVGGSSQLWLPAEAAEAHGAIRTYSGIWGQRTRYEANGNYASFGYRPSFHDRCNSWLYFWHRHSPWRKKIVVWSYGVHTDHRTSTAHNNGRGFDLTRIYPTFADGKRRRRFFGRYDIWKNYGATAKRRNRRWYWATSASVHHHFKHVLTYYYNSAHHNHIHFDNLASGTTNSSFSTGSRAQVQHVQACCRWLWGKSIAIDGVWGPETNRHSHQVLVRIGKGGYLTSSKSHWLAFNRASCRKGTGKQSY